MVFIIEDFLKFIWSEHGQYFCSEKCYHFSEECFDLYEFERWVNKNIPALELIAHFAEYMAELKESTSNGCTNRGIAVELLEALEMLNDKIEKNIKLDDGDIEIYEAQDNVKKVIAKVRGESTSNG